jgi:hypothetical protein
LTARLEFTYRDLKATEWIRSRAWPDWVSIGLLAAVVVLRRPDAVTNPNFFVDEGPMFSHALVGRSLLGPSGGYLIIFQRVVMAPAASLPSWIAPLFTNMVALTIATVVAGLLLIRLRGPLCCGLPALERGRQRLDQDLEVQPQ